MPSTALLLDQLAAQQHHALGTVEGLTDDQLATSTVPSGWTFAGMFQHLAVGTRFWARTLLLGEPEESWDDDFTLLAGVSPGQAVSAYAEAVSELPGLVGSLSLDAAPAWWPADGRWGPFRLDTVEQVLLHMLYETTTHAGHLDIARELLDGATWDVSARHLAGARLANLSARESLGWATQG